MAMLRLFASAREAAGVSRTQINGDTVGAVLAEAETQFGAAFSAVLATAKVWCNGEEVDENHPVGSGDEVAVLPPVSGG
jgi:sulfur-carrier protein